ncbi:hypothetical protein DACRYDRAFT_20764 [Dacryopinax primogenitus]|uniref:Uncharacterized protein n=1 Tax=Dacryopinax primogenitus (strain DJM 731) TaxID=1858805 RepID=M5G5Z0_DACPD|nr:uncharacterized protein DACRYDRAFT_20764 [Dacryopinax primogenitus]EJU04139.1 hypothetical protein DACRYDRAFT_20764 [Dacryopinax primogenitus]
MSTGPTGAVPTAPPPAVTSKSADGAYVPAMQQAGYYPPNMQPPVYVQGMPPTDLRGICLRQGHVPVESFGAMGIVAAICCFPIGIICCIMDRREQCSRCGEVLQAGCSN